MYNWVLTSIILYPPGRTATYQMSGSITSIADYSFYLCYGLTSISIASGVAQIVLGAFLVALTYLKLSSNNWKLCFHNVHLIEIHRNSILGN